MDHGFGDSDIQLSYSSGSGIAVRILNADSLHFMKRYFKHEITKDGKHEKFFNLYFVLS
jgi:hypothetical protein